MVLLWLLKLIARYVRHAIVCSLPSLVVHQAMNAYMTGNRISKPTATPEITNCGRRNPVELESIPFSVSGDGKDIRKKVIAHMVILRKK